MNKEQAERLIKFLAAVKTRPAIHIGRYDDHRAVQIFLSAVYSTCQISTKFDYEPFQAVVERRGWTPTGEGLAPSMREAGLSDEQIVIEMIDMHIEAYKQIFQLN